MIRHAVVWFGVHGLPGLTIGLKILLSVPMLAGKPCSRLQVRHNLRMASWVDRD